MALNTPSFANEAEQSINCASNNDVFGLFRDLHLLMYKGPSPLSRDGSDRASHFTKRGAYMRKTLLPLLAGLVLVAATADAQEVMRVHYIDVGQADATLLEFPCGAILIDAGAQDDDHVTALTNYLTGFFQGRTDLNDTLESIIITHNHIDHTRGLKEVVQAFTVNRYIDHGMLTGSGTGDPNWVRDNATNGGRNITIRVINDSDITALSHKNGLTDADIDPISCANIDPSIAVLSGRLATDPGWPSGEFGNKNNHSIVVRIDFGQASFLFTGDLEEPAIETMVDYYAGTNTLDVDVYQVGHHGSHNGTTDSLISAMSPTIAVFSVGDSDFGRNPPVIFSTFRFGHPRRVVVKALKDEIKRKRSGTIRPLDADASRTFRRIKIRDAIYATAWDGTVEIRATENGEYRVTRNN